MKLAALWHAGRRRGDPAPLIIHTGQHYDPAMSQVFFADLELPPPDICLDIGSGTHARQTAGVMTALEPVLERERPDWALVVGDVNSTLAAALVAAKLRVPLGHVEAGLRSHDRSMPEEINRLAVDAVSDLLFAPSREAAANLEREGHPPERIVFAGNVMIDTLLRLLPRAESRVPTAARPFITGGASQGEFVLVTLHRPANVDVPARLAGIAAGLATLAGTIDVVFPVHPRTRPLLEAELPPGRRPARLHLTPPLGYLDFLALERRARLVITDSGGVQEETTVLGIPCLTLRDSTERPITIREGTNRLIGSDPARLVPEARVALDAPPPSHARPEGWDGRAAERILEALHARTPPAETTPRPRAHAQPA
jgi:UDP-N-acetylglucosamine 2-epimerase (non-hydrolysing)